MFKFQNNSRKYNNFSFIEVSSEEKKDLKICPVKEKLFNNDLLSITDSNINILDSPLRQKQLLCGILILNKNKTYGLQKDKYLYMCIPNDKQLPYFYIPYKIKNLEFNKNLINKYILFKFNHWNLKFPQGTIIETIGNVNCFHSYCLYNQHCRNVFVSSSKFSKEIIKKTKCLTEFDHLKIILSQNPKIYDLRDKEKNIFSIDPENSKDFDDAFSIKYSSLNDFTINIYIANVYLWFEYLNLWTTFTNKKSTIYFPNKNDSMLPKILSENLCSLREKTDRFTFVCKFTIKNNNIENIEFFQALINVNKNYVYESKSLFENSDYKNLFTVCKNLWLYNKLIKCFNNSHDLVCYLMILMNKYSGNFLTSKKSGIFRCLNLQHSNINDLKLLPNNISDKAKILFNPSAEYKNYNEKYEHSLLNIKNYVHVTSPIRRIIDLINQILIINLLNLSVVSFQGLDFCKNNIKNLHTINSEIKQIKKLQLDCNNLYSIKSINNIHNREFNGYILNLQIKNNCYYYGIYIDELKILIRNKCIKQIELYKKYKCKIYLFDDEDTLVRKIKIDFLDEDKLKNKQNI